MTFPHHDPDYDHHDDGLFQPHAAALTFTHPVIGQEAICPDGLGRVIAFEDRFPHQWIQVSTYVRDRQCKWAPGNVKLVAIGQLEAA